jgi:hypothetical protein
MRQKALRIMPQPPRCLQYWGGPNPPWNPATHATWRQIAPSSHATTRHVGPPAVHANEANRSHARMHCTTASRQHVRKESPRAAYLFWRTATRMRTCRCACTLPTHPRMTAYHAGAYTQCWRPMPDHTSRRYAQAMLADSSTCKAHSCHARCQKPLGTNETEETNVVVLNGSHEGQQSVVVSLSRWCRQHLLLLLLHAQTHQLLTGQLHNKHLSPGDVGAGLAPTCRP